LSYKYPALTATQQAPSLTVVDAQRLAQELGVILVEYYRHGEGWCAFIVSVSGVHYIPLPDITDTLLQTMMTWLQSIENPFYHTRQTMEGPLYKLHMAVIAPLRDYLSADSKVVLAPHWILNLFPFGAARDPQTNRYTCEDYQLAVAPSLSALWVMHQQATKTKSIGYSKNELNVFSVAYASDIPELVPNTQQMIQAFAPNLVEQYDNCATPDTIIAAARQDSVLDILHIASHGCFNRELPEQSGLALYGGWLTVQRIIGEMPLQQTRLVTLASCLLGQASLEQSGEAVGITQAFLTAGAKSVVTALWSVEVNATMALFQAFYRQIRTGDPPAVAMREAMAEIRNTPGWEHPYYWAAWQVYGLAF
jgi:CHAT domain-containing protein